MTTDSGPPHHRGFAIAMTALILGAFSVLSFANIVRILDEPAWVVILVVVWASVVVVGAYVFYHAWIREGLQP